MILHMIAITIAINTPSSSCLIGALAISCVRFLLVAYSYRAANPNPVITIAMHPAIKGMMLSCDAAIEHA